MTHRVTIDRKLGTDALDWAKINCPGYVTNDIHQDGYYTYDDTQLDFFFVNNSADITAFALKWAGRKDLPAHKIS